MDIKYIEISTTVPSERSAEQISQIIVSRKLAACVQVFGPVRSSYWWRGMLETAEEWKCVFKTTRNMYHKVEKAIRDLHSYEVPEIIATPIVTGLDDYLKWMDEEVLQEDF